MPTVTLHHGDCLDVLPTLKAGSVDSCVCDPPYELAFMGKWWDATGVAFRPETWQSVLRVLKPGAYLLAFGGTRTYHRLTCAIEDAGFEIRDCLMWLFGQGFPKAKSCLKPGHEPIVLARKPGKNVLPLQIDACRIGTGGQRLWEKPRDMGYGRGTDHGVCNVIKSVIGRWPANVMLDGDAAAMLDTQAGIRTTHPGTIRKQNHRGMFVPARVGREISQGNSGGASRFFYCSKASQHDRNEGLDGKNTHPTVKPTNLMRWLCRLITPPSGIVLDPFAGSGSTGKAAVLESFSFIGIERHKPYINIARRRIAAANSGRPETSVAR